VRPPRRTGLGEQIQQRAAAAGRARGKQHEQRGGDSGARRVAPAVSGGGSGPHRAEVSDLLTGRELSR